MYSPTLGRFMQTDPAGYVDGPNLYSYVNNNSTSLIDPWGLMSPWVSISAEQFRDWANDPQNRSELERQIREGFIEETRERYVVVPGIESTIDLRHAVAAFNEAKKSGGCVAYLKGFYVELVAQWGKASSFAPEDLPSNAYGIKAAAIYGNVYEFLSNLGLPPISTLDYPASWSGGMDEACW